MKTILSGKWAMPVSFHEPDPYRSVQSYVKSAWQAFCRPFYDELRRMSLLRPSLAALLLAPLVARQAADKQPMPI